QIDGALLWWIRPHRSTIRPPPPPLPRAVSYQFPDNRLQFALAFTLTASASPMPTSETMTGQSEHPALPALIDIGANLGHESFDHDLDAVLARATAAGIIHLLVTGTSLPSTRRAQELVEQHPTLLSFTAGVHPHEAQHCSEDDFAQLKELAGLEKVLAVGETGLDFNRDYSPRPVQEAMFERQLELACELGKPVFLHQ